MMVGWLLGCFVGWTDDVLDLGVSTDNRSAELSWILPKLLDRACFIVIVVAVESLNCLLTTFGQSVSHMQTTDASPSSK